MGPERSGAPRLDEVTGRLRAAGCVFAEDEANLLLQAAADDDALLEDMLVQRTSGIPLEHVLGWVEFCGMRIAVDRGVFVPRRRTELLVREALRRMPAGRSVVVDLCCGAGAVGVAIAAVVPASTIHAVDIDPAAVACAERNLLSVSAAHRVHLGDLYDPLPEQLRGCVGVLVANAPYVPSSAIALMPAEARDHEPAVALDGGDDGVEVHRRIAAGAPAWLAPGGHLLIETSERQAARTASAARQAGMRTETVRDGAATVVVAR